LVPIRCVPSPARVCPPRGCGQCAVGRIHPDEQEQLHPPKPACMHADRQTDRKRTNARCCRAPTRSYTWGARRRRAPWTNPRTGLMARRGRVSGPRAAEEPRGASPCLQGPHPDGGVPASGQQGATGQLHARHRVVVRVPAAEAPAVLHGVGVHLTDRETRDFACRHASLALLVAPRQRHAPSVAADARN
jgi:hypothetical protein